MEFNPTQRFKEKPTHWRSQSRPSSLGRERSVVKSRQYRRFRQIIHHPGIRALQLRNRLFPQLQNFPPMSGIPGKVDQLLRIFL
ncbi:MAG TPA: hypothetical protein DDW68_08510 [Verrucomicrobiales bacterium]|nr:hypothetical protein [Verrucomicrobiales bacterium]